MKQQIKQALAMLAGDGLDVAARSASGGDLDAAAKALFDAMGYKSEKGGASYTAQDFFEAFTDGTPHAEKRQVLRARFCENACHVYAVSQISKEEIKEEIKKKIGKPTTGELNLNMPRDVNKDNTTSFVFLAVELQEPEYKRSEYAEMSRLLNRHLPMPLIILFRAGNEITLTFTPSRQHKRDNEIKVLGKVSLLRGINAVAPHRAHLEILNNLSMDAVFKTMDINRQNATFKNLLTGWEKTLNTDALSEKFYTELNCWFKQVSADAAVRFPNPKKKPMDKESHVLLLVTRLLFIWFMKEKGLVAEELFNQTRAQELLKDGDGNYYRAILQNLFFATLNTEISNRRWSKVKNTTHRVFNFYRYADLMQDKNRVFELMNKTPFVNGGLFDCLDSEEAETEGGYRLDCFTDNSTQREQLHVPDRLFFDATDGLFALFNRYKFTLEESTPVEQDVALDPELLGNVFENLLATIERKKTGSYYTPRTVVDYMVNSAIVEYLARHCAPDDGDIEYWRDRLGYLLDYARDYDDAEEFFQKREKEKLIDAISQIKVLDPAVGSGAFPMGVLQKLTLVLTRLGKDDKSGTNGRESGRENKQRRAYDGGDKKARYPTAFDAKLYLVQNSIYGVDIQPTACQIAKLRFFISLLIEQKGNDDAADNYGIKPLPNLETRFVAADSLMPLEQAQATLKSNEATALCKQLNENREKHFNAHNRREKLKCRKNDKALREELVTVLQNSGMPAGNAQKLADWDMYDNNAVATWFDSELMFGVRDGFDVIIGNPPYIRLQNNGGKLGNRYQVCGYDTFAGTGDIYCLFYEHGFNLLAPGGCLAYISSNKFMRAGYGANLRRFLRSKTTLHTVIDFGELPVFEADADPAIIITKRDKPTENSEIQVTVIKKAEDIPDLFNVVSKQRFPVEVRTLSDDGWTLTPPDVLALLNKMRHVGKRMQNYVQGMHNGIKTGLDKAFVIKEKKRREFIATDPKSAELIKPWLRGKDMKKWYSEYRNLHVIFTQRDTDIDNYPEIKKHLLQFKDKLLGRASPPAEYWYALQNPVACHTKFDKPKIIYSLFAKNLYASIDTKLAAYIANTSSVIFHEDNEYLLGVINSDLLDFYYRHIFYTLGDSWNNGRICFNSFKMQSVPIYEANKKQRNEIARRVKTILRAPQGKDVPKLEAEINELVYKLYGLTKAEIKLVEQWQQLRIR